MTEGREMADEVRELRKALDEALAPLLKARKALEALGRAGALERLDRMVKHVPALAASSLEAVGLEGRRAALAGELERGLERLRHERRMAVLGPLQRAAREAGIGVETVAEAPPTLLLAPLTVELDFEAGEARIGYAREVVRTARLAADEVLAAREAAMADIKAAAVPSEAFFALARRAYEMARVARGEEPGARLDLVDLLAPLTLLAAEADRWRRTPVSKMSDYPRYLLAYQLQRLRRDGLLEHDGARLELGVATGGSTRDKRNVIFVPSTATEGQYYLSVRFAAGGGR